MADGALAPASAELPAATAKLAALGYRYTDKGELRSVDGGHPFKFSNQARRNLAQVLFFLGGRTEWASHKRQNCEDAHACKFLQAHYEKLAIAARTRRRYIFQLCLLCLCMHTLLRARRTSAASYLSTLSAAGGGLCTGNAY